MSQTFALVLTCIIATLTLGLGVVALSPPPPPPSISVAAFVAAYQNGASERVDIAQSSVAPSFVNTQVSQPERMISTSLADGLSKPAEDVKVVMVAPAIFGLLPRPKSVGRGEMTIIDVPSGLSSLGPGFNMSDFLRNETIRVPPFWAAIRNRDASWTVLRPKEAIGTPWNIRLMVIFLLSILFVAPLAWLGARRWTRPVRTLARRVDTFDIHGMGPPVCNSKDAAEVQALETAFERLYARIIEHIDERTTLLMAVAHDLRTPLTSLRVRIEEVRPQLRDAMLRDIGRIGRMIDGILGFAVAKNSTTVRSIIDLGLVVEEALKSFPEADRSVSAELCDAPILGDQTEIARAVDNLIENALKFGKTVEVILSIEKNQAVLAVRDDGPGVPEEAIPRLTEPFFRVDKSRNTSTGGIGLGLATTNDIILRHGGRLRFRNLKPGFEARCVLPLVSHVSGNS